MLKRALLLVGLLTLAARADVGTAMVVRLEGDVRSGMESVHRLESLQPSQELSVPSGGSVTLLFLDDGHQEAVTGPAQLKVGETAGVVMPAGPPPSPQPPEAVRGGMGATLLRLLTPVVLHGPLPGLDFRAAPGAAGPFTVTLCGPLPPGFIFVSEASVPSIWKAKVKRTTQAEEEINVPYTGPALLPDRIYYWEVSNDDFNPPERRGLRLESPAARERREKALAGLKGDSQAACLKRMAVQIAGYQLQEALEEAHKAARFGVSPALLEVARCLQSDLGDPSRRQPWP